MEAKTKKASRKEIDLYASLSLQRAAIEKSLDDLRPGIEALGKGSHAGYLHALTLAEVTTSRLSVPIAKALMTPADIALATLTTTGIRITVDH